MHRQADLDHCRAAQPATTRAPHPCTVSTPWPHGNRARPRSSLRFRGSPVNRWLYESDAFARTLRDGASPVQTGCVRAGPSSPLKNGLLGETRCSLKQAIAQSLVWEALRQLVVAWPTLKMATMAFFNRLLGQPCNQLLELVGRLHVRNRLPQFFDERMSSYRRGRRRSLAPHPPTRRPGRSRYGSDVIEFLRRVGQDSIEEIRLGSGPLLGDLLQLVRCRPGRGRRQRPAGRSL